ncbi:ABC transporter substrate-binding protein [Alicyclobacillus sp. SO9]|uniref:ABC transporter substrate-binding protein n=1 Tax=Alicyclobacillus sp. SO9 TaxID=2665646 RepID=UPI0018E8F2AF|nr:ABC transporter substrate-binding protein [Alicyclobacillus sp. SO9]QQE78989.1 ABC transporter substrate-binding protein [Alicyclobacillus sp. SO9]
MMKRTWMTVASLALTGTVVAGCGTANSANGGNGTTGGSSTSKQGVVQLTYDYPVGVAGPLAKIMKNMVDKFNQSHSTIHVTPVFAGNYQQTLAKVETAVQSGNPPDVAVLNSTATFDLLRMNAISPLDSIVKNGNFYSALTKPEVQNHYWGVPFQRSTVVLYYNKDLFKKAGLDPSHGPKTWAELISDAQKIKAKAGVNGIEIPSNGTVYWTFEPFATEAGHNLGGSNGKTVYFNSSAVKKALNFWMDLSHKYKVMPKGIIQWNDVPSDFENQKTAMAVHSSGSLTSIMSKSNFNVGVSFLPKASQNGSNQVTGLGGGDMFVMKGISKKQHDAAITFVKWMTTPKEAAHWSMSTGYIGTSPAVYQQPSMKAYIKKHPQAMVAAKQLKYAQPELSTYHLNRIYDVIDSAIQSVMDGQSSVNSALNKAQKKADSILSQ